MMEILHSYIDSWISMGIVLMITTHVNFCFFVFPVPTTKEAADPYAGIEKSSGPPSVSSTKSGVPKSNISTDSKYRSKDNGDGDLTGKIIELDESRESSDMSATGGMFNMLQKAVC